MSMSSIQTVSQSIALSNGRILPNRFLKSAMTERLCTWSQENLQERGKPTPEYIKLYEEWGKGGLGVCVLGNIPCDVRYPEAIHNACMDPISKWDVKAAFEPVIKAARGPSNCIVIGQVTHAGRQTANHITDQPISASDIQSPPLGGMEFAKPRPATIDEIHDIVKRFGFAAKTLYDAGADGVQMHCAHGYLLSQFLSPRVNKRTDQYGGSLENRSRILFEILEEIKKQVPDENFIRSIKINSADFSEGGFSEEESREMCQKLEAAGMHLIELSGDESLAFAHKKESTKKREAFFIEFADRMRPHLKSAKLCVTGGFRSIHMMAKAIHEGSCDIVGLARPLTGELHLPNLLMSGKQTKAGDNLVAEGAQLPAAYFQLKEAGDGKIPSDLSKADVAKQIQEAIERDPAGAMRLNPSAQLLHKDY